MREEFESLIKNNTWKLVDKTNGGSVIDNKVYSIESNTIAMVQLNVTKHD